MVWKQGDDIWRQVPYRDALQAACREVDADAWLVGGCIRDLLLDRPPLDIDLATADPERMARAFAAHTGGAIVPLDVERDTWRIAQSGERYFDFCRFRDTDLLGDLRGRDFTINALALRVPPDGEHAEHLVDPFQGRDDLRACILRMVYPSVFHDDPVRILRAFRFLAELPMTLESRTLDAVRAEAARLPAVAPERLQTELLKLCAGPYANAALMQMDAAGVLDILIPELRAARDVTQNDYHLLDVHAHLLLAAERMAQALRNPGEAFGPLAPAFSVLAEEPRRRARLVLAALLHDIGKPETRTVERGRTHFYDHETVGATIAMHITRRLRMSREDTRLISRTIAHHMRPLFLLQARARGPLSRRAMLRFFDATREVYLEVLALALADHAAGRGPAADPDTPAQLLALYGDLLDFYVGHYRIALEHPLVTGDDLIAALGLPEGETLGRILRAVHRRQRLGEVTSREEALRWAAMLARDDTASTAEE